MKCNKCKGPIKDKKELCVGFIRLFMSPVKTFTVWDSKSLSFIRPYHKECFEKVNRERITTYAIETPLIGLDKLRDYKKKFAMHLFIHFFIALFLSALFLFTLLPSSFRFKDVVDIIISYKFLVILAIFLLILYIPISNLIYTKKIENLR